MIAAILTLGAFALLSRFYWNQIFEAEGAPARRRFLIWAVKGLLGPVLLWLVFNCGLLPGSPGFLPEVVENRSRGGPWVGVLFRSLGPVLFLVSSFWAAVTIGWLLSEFTVQARDRHELAVQCAFFSFFLAPLAGLIFYATGLRGLGAALLLWLVPLVHFCLPLERAKIVPPSYARAVARMKFGKYKDAEREVLKELEQCEDNVEGWMMLADLYANHFNDLPEADRTIRELCGQPNVIGIQISLALHRLADWLVHCGVTSVAMQSTGVYWIPVYEILEARGLDLRFHRDKRFEGLGGRLIVVHPRLHGGSPCFWPPPGLNDNPSVGRRFQDGLACSGAGQP